MASPFDQRMRRISDICEARREIVSMVAHGNQLSFLLVNRPDSQDDRTFSYVGHQAQDLVVEALNARGSVSAYAYHENEHVLIFDSGVRCEHQLYRGRSPEELRDKSYDLIAAGWQLAGAAQVGNGLDAIFKRALPVDRLRITPTSDSGGASAAKLEAASRQAKQALKLDLHRACVALEKLVALPCSAEERKKYPWHVGAPELASALKVHQTSPLIGYLKWADLLEATSRSSGVSGAFYQAVSDALVASLQRDMVNNRVASLCIAAAGVGAPTPAAREVLAGCVARAGADTAAMTEKMDDHLQQAVGQQSVAGVSLLVALGYASSLPSAQKEAALRQAQGSGNYALLKALDGDVSIVQEWERLGPRQKKALCTVSGRAAKLSRDATMALAQRFVGLGFESTAPLTELREFVQQKAPLWMQFKPEADNNLLKSLHYVSNSARDGIRDSTRYEGLYEKVGLAPEESPKYGWLNVQKSLLGFEI
jgi:hypothetical protein